MGQHRTHLPVCWPAAASRSTVATGAADLATVATGAADCAAVATYRAAVAAAAAEPVAAGSRQLHFDWQRLLWTLLGQQCPLPTCFQRCQWTSSATQTASLANCQAACDAVASCVAIGFKVNTNCGLQMSVTVSTSTCPTGSSTASIASTRATYCSVVYATSHTGYACYRRGCCMGC